ncbi:MAG: sigma-70 family RNA polymerase sigma factor [Bacillota bacterium]
MSINNGTTITNCRMMLKRAAWRIQYSVRMQRTRESSSLVDCDAYNRSFEMDILSKIYVKELLDTIPCEKCRYIIKRVIIEEVTEKEVAKELQITQQAVNKWKKKGLESIRRSLGHSLM